MATKSKFTKSKSNKQTEKEGLALLLTDPRFQLADLPTKKRILQLIGTQGGFSTRTLDAVMTPKPMPPITAANVEGAFRTLCLIEMKTTIDSIKNESLEGFFFGATENEYEMARLLGDRYLFAFVVLNSDNKYGRPFAVLLTLDEVERRTRLKRIQYQVNFHTDLSTVGGTGSGWLVLFGDQSDIPLV